MAGGARDTFLSQLKQLVLALEHQDERPEDLFVPATIFSFSLSPLQSLVTYLKDTYRFSFKDIAARLSRSYPTVYAAYRPGMPSPPPTMNLVPLAVFGQGRSVLEACVVYLREDQKMRLSEIARLLNKDPRTIWSTYDRAKKRR